MTTRECDHCSDHTAELMSLVDHEFTGDEVRAINRYMAELEAEHAAELVGRSEEWRTWSGMTLRRAEKAESALVESEAVVARLLAEQDLVNGPKAEAAAARNRAEEAETELADARATIHKLADALGYVDWSDCGRYMQAGDDELIEAVRAYRREVQEAAESPVTLAALNSELETAYATIERISALPDKWRADYRAGYEPQNAGRPLPDVHTCIVELRGALRKS